MAAVCRFYGYTPDQFRALRLGDLTTLLEYQEYILKKQGGGE